MVVGGRGGVIVQFKCGVVIARRVVICVSCVRARAVGGLCIGLYGECIRAYGQSH